MIKALPEENAFLIQWLSNVLGHELSEEQFNQYQEGVFEPLFQALEEEGFGKYVIGMKDALANLKADKFGYLELAADFTETFLLDGESSALPYASAYLDEEATETNLKFMDGMLDRFQLQINKESKEPSDHLCVYLEILNKLIPVVSESEQQLFVEHYLLTWLVPFYEKVQKIPTKTQFYQNTVGLLIAILTA
ncbi:molecular chaperone TorD [Actinobacillus delphinicola]|uniref:Chaperone protein TorD n=1 Tax=Actinobacillus delphinicola TaxID=51161 RepID=A0A448TUR0_9PAST|nr:molecular chaperone TorD [Actinobacillus delphinicola]VEJ09581.1 chaperone protein TorD [Actinobacillus delphinicola]